MMLPLVVNKQRQNQRGVFATVAFGAVSTASVVTLRG